MNNDNITHNNEKDNFKALMELLKPEGFRRVCRVLEHAIGTAEASLYAELLGRYEYFEERGQLDEEGFFFNTVLDLQHGTALSDKRQRTAIKRLEQLQLIETKLKDSPPKRYFKINDNEELLIQYLSQGRQQMDQFKEQIRKQKSKVEEDREQEKGYFSPEYKGNSKSAEREDLKSAILADSNITKGQTNKNNVNKNNKSSRAAATNSNIKDKELQEVAKHYQDKRQAAECNEYQITSRQLEGAKKLLKDYGSEDAKTIINFMFNEENDTYYRDNNYPLTTLAKQAEIKYSERLANYKEMARREAAAKERNRQQQEKWQREEEELAREKAEFDALPEEEKRRQKIKQRREFLTAMIGARQGAADQGDQEAENKLKQYKQELQELDREAAELNQAQEGGQAQTG